LFERAYSISHRIPQSRAPAALRNRQPWSGCAARRRPSAMAVAISTLLVTLLLMVAGPGLPRAAGGRPLAPADGAASDRVKSLPEFGRLGSALQMYSGYLNVSGLSGADREVFYSFTESERQPSKDPLVLWLQGCAAADAQQPQPLLERCAAALACCAGRAGCAALCVAWGAGQIHDSRCGMPLGVPLQPHP
jgi:hypothetical protein